MVLDPVAQPSTRQWVCPVQQQLGASRRRPVVDCPPANHHIALSRYVLPYEDHSRNWLQKDDWSERYGLLLLLPMHNRRLLLLTVFDIQKLPERSIVPLFRQPDTGWQRPLVKQKWLY